jgi:hypothetical protein
MLARARNRGKRRVFKVSVEGSSSPDRAEEMLMKQKGKNNGPLRGNCATIYKDSSVFDAEQRLPIGSI